MLPFEAFLIKVIIEAWHTFDLNAIQTLGEDRNYAWVEEEYDNDSRSLRFVFPSDASLTRASPIDRPENLTNHNYDHRRDRKYDQSYIVKTQPWLRTWVHIHDQAVKRQDTSYSCRNTLLTI